MANRYYRSQFMYTFEKMPVKLFGRSTLAQLGQYSTLTNQGLTYTAATSGVAGDSIEIELLDPGGNSEPLTISVSGTTITASLATDGGGLITTTATLLQAALAANAQVAALVTVTGSGGSALTALAATPLAGGVDYAGSGAGIHEINLTGAGLYQIILQDKYKALLQCSVSILKATAADLVPQLWAEDVDNTKIITFRTLAGATPTSILSGNELFIELTLRNSEN